LLALQPAAAGAQTDYYNTDAGRPVRIEDAYATERHAFELKLAPVRVERGRGGLYAWGFEPEIAYGVLPRTHIELGLPLAILDGDGTSSRAGVAGVEFSVLHNLNTETQSLPAFGLRGDVLLPIGRFGPERTYVSLSGLVTRTWWFARLHVNGRYTVGSSSDPSAGENALSSGHGSAETERWLAGFALDRAFPLDAMLLIADLFARKPIDANADVEWHAGAGIRYQLSPRLAVDAGIGRQLTGDPVWSLTFGTAYAFGLRALIRGSGNGTQDVRNDDDAQ
jgi:hypothetical protein